MKAKGKDCKRICAALLAPADVMEDYAEIKEEGQAVAKQIIAVTGTVPHLRAVYHRLSACLTALFTELDTRGKSYEEIAESDDLPPADWREA